MIATHNRERELRLTLHEINKLCPGPAEILICADGCSDHTAAMVRNEFPKCRLLENVVRRGSVFSRDRMLREASHEIVISLDDDSYPLSSSFIDRVQEVFKEHSDAAIVSFAEIRDGVTFSKRSICSRHLASAYANCGAAMRRSVYLESSGFPSFFEHMYEEPDYALQCYGLGHTVLFEPSLQIRHHVSETARHPLRRHHLNARNELWSVLMRCPWPQLPVVACFRIWRQFRYACTEGFNWAVSEPRWWWGALLGIPNCVRRRSPIRWSTYLRWMKLGRTPEPLPKPI